ncbi:hypothetical protein CGLO_10681 [Colletotrichum gloeosporioides Cg-14]|uniref:Uncharacterized protein n=1 Tax=Colletotrichum gloeosporioides (strain Cg-14) TaxID=1237896 RepID=T0KD11_COLGC|nr:hypothetical protein CGLO_10681 [Colletotrichum gloeosporioides Cg-14]
MGVGQAFDFVSRAVPVLNEYCTRRYGEQWSQFKKETNQLVGMVLNTDDELSVCEPPKRYCTRIA